MPGFKGPCSRGKPLPLLRVRTKGSEWLRYPAKPGDVGYDILARVKITVPPGETLKINSGVAVQPEPGFWTQVVDRSSLAKLGLKVYGGIVDTGYTGDIHVMLHNSSDQPVTIEQGNGLAQLVIHERHVHDLCAVDDLDETERGDTGFGSTDRNKGEA